MPTELATHYQRDRARRRARRRCQRADVERGLAAGAHAIACDAGSTDSGPAYLATGKAKYSRAAIKRDLAILMRAQAKGRCALAHRLVRHLRLRRRRRLDARHRPGDRPRGEALPRIALLYSEQQSDAMAAHAAAGRVSPLAPLRTSEPALFAGCERIVALMGPEPYVAALSAGADIVLGGRTTDTAVLAAVPLMHGAGTGPAWHAAKIAECGGLCHRAPARRRRADARRRDAFEIEPLSAGNRCTP
jgi:hypothetical protein